MDNVHKPVYNGQKEDLKIHGKQILFLLQNAVILRRICQLTLDRITHRVSRVFVLNLLKKFDFFPLSFCLTRGNILDG